MRALAVLIVLFASGLVLAAHAQPLPAPGLVTATLAVAVDDPGHPLAPGKNESLDVHLTYSPAAGAQPGPGTDPDPTSENASQKTKVTFKVKQAPAWITNVTFDPPTVEFSLERTGGSAGRNCKVILHIDPKAPALDKQVFTIEADAETNGNIQPATGVSPDIKIKPLFVAKINMTAPAAQVIPGGRWTEMPFTLRNFGNGETKVKLNVTARPQDAQVDYPDTAIVPLNGSTIVNVKLRVPWTYGESGAVTLEATPLPIGETDPQPGPAVHKDIEVEGQSAVPGPGFGLTIAAAVGMVLARRRA